MSIRIGIGIKPSTTHTTPPDPALAIINDGNTVGWYDFKDLSVSPIAIWYDKSGLGNNLTGVVGKRPTLTATGMLFDGISQYLNGAFAFTQPATIYIVLKQVAWSLGARIMNGNVFPGCLITQLNVTPEVAGYAQTNCTPDNNLAIGTYGIITFIPDGANGEFQINQIAPFVGNMGPNTLAGFTLGANASGGACSNIEAKGVILRKIHEVSGNKMLIQNYLKSYYSV